MYLYMMVHPGKKLSFMGNEFGQLREWDEKRQQDWDLFQYPAHDSFAAFLAALNRLYQKEQALSKLDYLEQGFQWLDCRQEQRQIYVIARRSKTRQIVAIFNFGSRPQEYTLPILPKNAKILLHTDWEPFGGKTKPGTGAAFTENAIRAHLPPFSGMLVKLDDSRGGA